MSIDEILDELYETRAALKDLRDSGTARFPDAVEDEIDEITAEIARLEAGEDPDGYSDEWDGQPDEAAEWYSYDPDC